MRGSAPDVTPEQGMGAGDLQGAIAARLQEITEDIRQAAVRSGREPSAVTLVAVSKGFGAEAVRAARALGHADFGESTAQELRRKAQELSQGVRWHFIGRLQRNKAKDVVGVANLIHSVDRLELAQEIADLARRAGRVQRVLVQVNVGGDPAKAGCAPQDTIAFLAKVRQLPGIACQGLMTIPPLAEDPRPVFRALRELRNEARARFPEVGHLSMGMSADFEIAVEEGATIVRLGEAIFGPRPDGRVQAGTGQ